MNCPYCNHPLTGNDSAGKCPSCGRELPAGPPPIPVANGPKPSWLWFWAALLAPPLLTLLTARVPSGVAVAITFLGGGAGGLVCGIILGVRLGKNPGARVGLALVLAFIMVPVCIMMCFFGCALGGYQMDMK